MKEDLVSTIDIRGHVELVCLVLLVSEKCGKDINHARNAQEARNAGNVREEK
jgi:hypothetical protein